MVVVTEVGYIYIYNRSNTRLVLYTKLPQANAIVSSVELQNEGTAINLTTSQGTFCFDSTWTLVSEPLESLVIKSDEKSVAQLTVLENDLAAAVQMENLEAYEKAASRYLLFLASYGPLDAFVTNWYSVIEEPLPFQRDQVHQIWIRIIEDLSMIDRVSSWVDELRLSLNI
jgi:hypothetical protein